MLKLSDLVYGSHMSVLERFLVSDYSLETFDTFHTITKINEGISYSLPFRPWDHHNYPTTRNRYYTFSLLDSDF